MSENNGANPKRLSKEQKKVKEFVEYMQTYWNTYTEQSSYINFNENTLINDALYGIGVALNKEEYQWRQGFDKFKKHLKENYLDTIEILEEEEKDGKIFWWKVQCRVAPR